MHLKPRFFILLGLSLACLLSSLGIALAEVNRYNASLAFFPPGATIAGIPMGGLDANTAGLRLIKAYSQTPVELRINGQAVQIDPAAAGQQLDLAGMLRKIEEARGQRSYWAGYWDFLWNRPPAAAKAPLLCSASAEQLHAYLQEKIAPAYNQPPTAAQPTQADVLFHPGQPGSTLNLDDAEPAIRAALCSVDKRTVDITSGSADALPPTIDSLGPVLESLTQVSTPDFDGMIEVYFQDLRTGKEINFAYNQGHAVPPDIAFTGASTIKIPVMVAAYKTIDGALPDELRKRMELMIDLSDNGSTDEVMRSALDENIAPVQITQDMQALGLKNTFLAGFFYPGAPLLDRYSTPANQRTDLTTDPDIYNQTTAADMGRLLAAIQRCAADGSGLLTEKFSGKITQAECQEMTGLLKKNRKGVLLEAGLPEGTEMAHKYGWVTDSNDGLLHTTSDAAIVYTPGGDFVFTVYLYHPEQLNWDAAQRLVARLATAVYNFYNGWH